MYDALANTAQFERVILFAVCAPLIFRSVEIAEESGSTGPEKRQEVMEVTADTVAVLVQQGWLPAELNTEKAVGELIDTAVVINNGSGLFKHKNSKKEKK